MLRARRIATLPPYLFAGLQRAKAEIVARGTEVIDLGAGVPDTAPPAHVLAAFQAALQDPAVHRYPPYGGTTAFKDAIARYYLQRFGVALDPDRECLALIGSKEGLVQLCYAMLDPGDVALVPDPGYPAYATAIRLAGATPVAVPLEPAAGWRMDLGKVDPELARRAKLLFLNYPSNPTGAIASRAALAEIVAWARRHQVLVASDLAYGELTLEGVPASSILAVPGASEVALEFNSLSKSHGMAGWRIGMAVGNAEAISALGVLKSHTDTGVWSAIQAAGVAALLGPQDHLPVWRERYRQRRDRMVTGLQALGYPVLPNPATFYLWVPVPKGSSSGAFAQALLETAGVLVAPGSAYGAQGEGYFRIALTQDVPQLERVLARLERHGFPFG